jgi:hypothetical protein
MANKKFNDSGEFYREAKRLAEMAEKMPKLSLGQLIRMDPKDRERAIALERERRMPLKSQKTVRDEERRSAQIFMLINYPPARPFPDVKRFASDPEARKAFQQSTERWEVMRKAYAALKAAEVDSEAHLLRVESAYNNAGMWQGVRKAEAETEMIVEQERMR